MIGFSTKQTKWLVPKTDWNNSLNCGLVVMFASWQTRLPTLVQRVVQNKLLETKHCYPLEYEGENQAFSSQKHASFKGSQQMLYYIITDHDQCNCANERHSSTFESGHQWLTFEIAKLEHVSPSLTGSCRERLKNSSDTHKWIVPALQTAAGHFTIYCTYIYIYI